MENYILITGASSGIGRATAIELSKGATLILGGRNIERLEETRRLCENSERHIFWAYDLRDVAGIGESLTALIKDNALKIGGFVHSAGIECTVTLNRLSTEEMHNVMDVNFFSAAEILKVLITRKINSKNLKSVVFMSSIASLRGTKGFSFYSASKGALDSFARSMAMELAPNTRVNVINAGIIKTPLIEIYRQNEELLDNALDAEYPLKRLGKPEEVANLIEFLMSDKGAWITGQNIVIDGGLSARTI